MNPPAVKRRYDATRRREQARQLRVAVVDAARVLFVERGFVATTIGEIADEAGVSQQLVYAAFGSKRGLLAKVLDWTVAGDDEPVPMAERPTIVAIRAEPTVVGKCALHARHIRLLAPRIAPTLQMLRAAADADPDARAILGKSEGQRRTGTGLLVGELRGAGALRADMTDDQIADALWALAPDVVWTALVTRRGWSADEFELWYAGQVAVTALEDRQVAAVRRFSRKLIARSGA